MPLSCCLVSLKGAKFSRLSFLSGWLTIGCLIAAMLVHAQSASPAASNMPVVTLPFERFTVDNGLSQGMVRGIIQDKKGFMWFATKDGLNRYDGYKIIVYRNDPKDPFSIPDNQVSALLEDPNGNLWVGTGTKGLCVFDRETGRFYHVGINHKSHNGFYEDIGRMEYKGGQLILRLGPAIEVIDVKNVKPGMYAHINQYARDIFSTDHIKRVNTDEPLNFLLLNNNNLLIISHDSCFVLHQKEGSGYLVAKKYSLKNPSGAGALPDGLVVDSIRRRYYIVSAYGNNNYQVTFPGNTGFGQMPALPAFKDSAGKIWVLDSLIYQFSTSDKTVAKLTSTDAEITRLLKNVISFCVDRNGIVWLGTGAYGMIKFDSHLTRFKKFNLGSIYYLDVDNAGRVNYFPQGHKMEPAYFDLEHAINYKNLIPPMLVRPQWSIGDVTNIVNDKRGDYWMVVSTDNNAPPGKTPISLLKYSPANNTVTLHLTGPQFLGYRYKAIIKDNNDNIWIFGNDSNEDRIIIKYNREKDWVAGKWKFPVDKGIDNYPFISAWWQDDAGVFWFGTRRFGLFRFNEKTMEWKQFRNNPNDSASLPSDKIFSLCPDPDSPQKYVWVGTEGAGFCRFELSTGKCRRFGEKDGLLNNVVYGMLSDVQGNLWLSTNHGLSCFTPPGLTSKAAGASFINFTKQDGIQDDEFNRYSAVKTAGGTLVFGGVNGITWFNPADVLKKDAPPQLVFTGLSIFNKPVSYKTDSSVLALPIEYANSISLPFSKNMFTVSFAELEYSSPEKKKYKYWLEGFDDDWIDNGAKNEATFTNLDPGTYTFHVKSAGRDGAWNTQEQLLTVIINPPFWLTWWFQTLAIFAFVAVVYGLSLYRLSQTLKVQKMRNRIASDLHDEIGSTLSSISLSSAVIQNKLVGTTDEVKTLLDQLSINADNMMEAMGDIVWSINTKNDRFDNIAMRMRAFATGILEPQNCLLQIKVDASAEAVKLNMQQRKNLYLVFKEAVNNSAKYAKCKNVWIDIAMAAGKKMVMVIKDDGAGFTIEQKGKKYFVATSMGNGLANMQKRAEELNGSLAIQSAMGQGTTLCLEFYV